MVLEFGDLSFRYLNRSLRSRHFSPSNGANTLSQLQLCRFLCKDGKFLHNNARKQLLSTFPHDNFVSDADCSSCFQLTGSDELHA